MGRLGAEVVGRLRQFSGDLSAQVIAVSLDLFDRARLAVAWMLRIAVHDRENPSPRTSLAPARWKAIPIVYPGDARNGQRKAPRNRSPAPFAEQLCRFLFGFARPFSLLKYYGHWPQELCRREETAGIRRHTTTASWPPPDRRIPIPPQWATGSSSLLCDSSADRNRKAPDRRPATRRRRSARPTVRRSRPAGLAFEGSK